MAVKKVSQESIQKARELIRTDPMAKKTYDALMKQTLKILRGRGLSRKEAKDRADQISVEMVAFAIEPAPKRNSK